MSEPFSNVHLRVPRGFGSILEGLAREVLRDQPDDIPGYAAQYFDSLLEKREESGQDPAEWAASLEDRFNYDVFLHPETSPDWELASEMTISKEKSDESQTEDESSRSSEASCSSTQPRVSEKLDSTESTNEGEINTTEKFSISSEKGLSEIKSVADGQSNEENNGEKKEVPTETTLDKVGQAAMEMDENHDPDQHKPQSDSEPSILVSFKDISNVEVTTHELGPTKDGGDQQESETVDKAIVDSSQKTTEEGTVQKNTDVEEDKGLTPQLEENAELSQSKQDFTQDSQQEDNDQAQKNNKGERTEAKASFGETNEVLVSENDLDNSAMPKDSSVEISFKDVPEAQGISEVEGKNLVRGASAEIAQNNELEMQQKQESMELTATSAHQNMSDPKDQLKHETEKDKKESNSEEEEIQSPKTGQSQPENTSDIKKVTSEEEEECMKKMTDSEEQQKSKEMEEKETFSIAHSTDSTAADLEAENRPDESKENTTASVNKVDEVDPSNA